MKRLVGLLFFSAASLASISALSYNDPYQPRFIPAEAVHGGSWFVGVGGGFDWVSLGNKTNTLLNNVSGSPSDTFTLGGSPRSSGAQQVSAGYRWDVTNSRYLSLQLAYEHINSITQSGTRTPVGSASFAVPYGFSVSHQTLLLLGQFDLFKWHKVMPFMQAGIGFSRNKFSNYTDTSTVFTMPAFPDASHYDLSTIVGAGLDFAVSSRVLMSLAYRFGWWGDAKSGDVTTVSSGSTLPGPIHLTNSINSQQILATLTYLFSGDKN